MSKQPVNQFTAVIASNVDKTVTLSIRIQIFETAEMHWYVIDNGKRVYTAKLLKNALKIYNSLL